jgi:hypothetical protein
VRGAAEGFGVDELAFVFGGEPGHDDRHVAAGGDGGSLGGIVGGGVADLDAGQRGPQAGESGDGLGGADVG